MLRQLFDMLELYRFGCKRRMHCLSSILRCLRDPALADLRAEVEAAHLADSEVHGLEEAWSLDPHHTLYAPGVVAPHRALNRGLRALHGGLGLARKAFEEESAKGRAATLLRRCLFENGLRFLTHCDYVSQTTRVDRLLEVAQQQPEVAEALRELQLGHYVERVAELNAELRRHLERGAHRPDHATLRQANRAGEDRLRRVVYLLAARLMTPGISAAEEDELSLAVLQVVEQNRAIRIYRKRRRYRIARANRGAEDEPLEEREHAEGDGRGSATEDGDPGGATNSPPIAEPGDPDSGVSRAG